MKRSQLLPALAEYLNCNPAPHVLIIHLGENDLCYTKGVQLRFSACRDLAKIKEWLPSSVIIWSELLQRRVWRDARNPAKVEKKRREVSAQVGTFVRSLGGLVVAHPTIHFSRHDLYRGDGVHLSHSGADIFLRDLQHGIRGLLPLSGWRRGQALG